MLKGLVRNKGKGNVNKVIINEDDVNTYMEAKGFQDFKVAITIIMDYVIRKPIKKYVNGCDKGEDGSSLNDYYMVEDRPFDYTLGDSLEDDNILYVRYIEAIFDE